MLSKHNTHVRQTWRGPAEFLHAFSTWSQVRVKCEFEKPYSLQPLSPDPRLGWWQWTRDSYKAPSGSILQRRFWWASQARDHILSEWRKAVLLYSWWCVLESARLSLSSWFSCVRLLSAKIASVNRCAWLSTFFCVFCLRQFPYSHVLTISWTAADLLSLQGRW